MNRHHYMPTAEQREQLRLAGEQLKAKTALARDRAKRDAIAAAPVMEMLSVVIGVKPMDNPIVNSTFGDLE